MTTGVGFVSGVTPPLEPANSVASAADAAVRDRMDRVLMAEAAELLVSNLALVERAIAFTCRRHRVSADEQEEFAATVKLRLVENDYAILRKFEGRSSFAAFINVVVHRMLLDYRIHHWGKWHPSAEAKRLGNVAVELERLLLRDGRSLDEAFKVLRRSDPSLELRALQELADRLPQRPAKPRLVALEEAESVGDDDTTELALQHAPLSDRVSALVREYIGSLEPHDRLVLQLRFDAGMTVADIARSLQLDPRKLYRSIEARLGELRRALEAEGVAAEEAAALIRDRSVVLDFRLDEVRT